MLNNLENLDVFMTCLIRLLSRFLKIYIMHYIERSLTRLLHQVHHHLVIFKILLFSAVFILRQIEKLSTHNFHINIHGSFPFL